MLKRSDASTPTYVLKAALHGVHREKAALAEQVLQRSLELQQAKAAGGVSAEASNASQQVLLHTNFHSMQDMLCHGSVHSFVVLLDVCLGDVIKAEQVFLRVVIAFLDDAKLPLLQHKKLCIIPYCNLCCKAVLTRQSLFCFSATVGHRAVT